ncbi:MAG: transposase, partial [Coriobacteriaceae bacterium]
LKVRAYHRTRPMALMIAMGMTRDKMTEFRGFRLKACESRKTWGRFLSSLRACGLLGMSMFTSDAHEGIVFALQEVYPDVPWQRFQAHFSHNVFDAAPKRLRAGLCLELAEMFNCATLKEARAHRDEIAAN